MASEVVSGDWGVAAVFGHRYVGLVLASIENALGPLLGSAIRAGASEVELMVDGSDLPRPALRALSMFDLAINVWAASSAGLTTIDVASTVANNLCSSEISTVRLAPLGAPEDLDSEYGLANRSSAEVQGEGIDGRGTNVVRADRIDSDVRGLFSRSVALVDASLYADCLDSDVAELLTSAPLEAITEFGQTSFELLGLEVARLHVLDGIHQLSVGVGLYDQGASAAMLPDASLAVRLEQTLATVLRHRCHDARPHPLNRLARQRWMRADLVAQPEQLGLQVLSPVEPPYPRLGVRDPAPAFAVGTSSCGTKLIACSVGIDPNLVTSAAALAYDYKPAEVVFVLRQKDQHQFTKELAAKLTTPTSFFDMEPF